MSISRTLMAALAAMVIASPVFADDINTQTTTETTVQSTDGSMQTTTTSQSTETKINLNTANAKDLMKVKGINASKARAIVAYRKKHGNFQTMDDLAKVKGFTKLNDDKLKEIQDQVSIN